ncbi:hypothetical protein [Dissulfurispira thermophila]|uniref:Uncharacterized protein n=1 Tax=hot springs metagenome TaxID=433727 RepID=A0A5J4L237_9ZZZZ|nr:hypothetical protein [Dissulfurispira thermophila]
MRFFFDEKRFSESTGKLHIYCPYREKTGINIHVVIKDGYCYRSRQCMIVQCKFNSIQLDIEALLSLVW